MFKKNLVLLYVKTEVENYLSIDWTRTVMKKLNKQFLLQKKMFNSKLTANGSDQFVLIDYLRQNSLEKYSELCENKIVLLFMSDKRSNFCVLSFLYEIFDIPGEVNIEDILFNTDTYMCFDIISYFKDILL